MVDWPKAKDSWFPHYLYFSLPCKFLDVKEKESSSKINIRDVSWWMSIKETCRLGPPIIAKFLKEGCISLATRERPFHVARKHD
jgi:hypothetical protein